MKTTSTIYLIQRWHVGDTWRNFGGHYPRKSNAQLALSIIINLRPGRYRIIPATMTITIPPSQPRSK